MSAAKDKASIEQLEAQLKEMQRTLRVLKRQQRGNFLPDETPDEFEDGDPLAAYATPAERVYAAFGGVRKLAALLGRNPSSVSRWAAEANGGLNGRVPANLQATLLDLAKQHARYPLRAYHLIVKDHVCTAQSAVSTPSAASSLAN